MLLLALALPHLPASAAPAPWYWWTSKLDGQRVCQQTSPGYGWLRSGGPYRDGSCQRPLTK